MGKFLKEIMSIVEERIKEDVHFERIFNILKIGINKIRKKLVEGFFSFSKIKIDKTNRIPKRIKKIQKLKKSVSANSKVKDIISKPLKKKIL